jgi:hypothetical protein
MAICIPQGENMARGREPLMRRNCKKNQRKMYYALYGNKTMIYDDDGNPTLEYEIGYYAPVVFYASLSTGKSDSEESPFGNTLDYDRTIITTDMNLPVDENSLIWVKSVPEINPDGSPRGESADYKVAAPVLDGLDSLRIAVKFKK